MIKTYVILANAQDEIPINTDITEQHACKLFDYIVNQANILDISALRNYNLEKVALNADILICNDSRITELNREYRGQNKPTDVLTFALFADSPSNRFIIEKEICLGEIIISANMAEKQAKEHNKTLEEEICFLLSHGILHLLGFDHPTESSLNFMLKIQDEAIKQCLKN